MLNDTHHKMSESRPDTRRLKTRRALRAALADEILRTKDLTSVTVTSLCEQANITRRTFYAHYRDIPHMVDTLERELLEATVPYVQAVANVTLDELSLAVSKFSPCPHVEELLEQFVEHRDYLPALLGEGGDPDFAHKLQLAVRDIVEERAHVGLDPLVPDFLLDYYLTFAISAEVGVLVRWVVSGMHESTKTMARLMTTLMFVKPGDFYGHPLGIDLEKLRSAARLAKLH